MNKTWYVLVLRFCLSLCVCLQRSRKMFANKGENSNDLAIVFRIVFVFRILFQWCNKWYLSRLFLSTFFSAQDAEERSKTLKIHAKHSDKRKLHKARTLVNTRRERISRTKPSSDNEAMRILHSNKCSARAKNNNNMPSLLSFTAQS